MSINEAVVITLAVCASLGMVTSATLAIARVRALRALRTAGRNGKAELVSRGDIRTEVIHLAVFALLFGMSVSIARTVYGAGLGYGSEARMYGLLVVVVLMVIKQAAQYRDHRRLLAMIAADEGANDDN